MSRKNILRKFKRARRDRKNYTEIDYSGTAVVFRGSKILPLFFIVKDFKRKRGSLSYVSKYTNSKDANKLQNIPSEEKIIFNEDLQKDDFLSWTTETTGTGEQVLLGYTEKELTNIMQTKKGIILFTEKGNSKKLYKKLYSSPFKYNIITIDVNPPAAEIALILSGKERKEIELDDKFIKSFNKIENLLMEQKQISEFPKKIEIKTVFLKNIKGIWETIDNFQKTYIEREKIGREQGNPILDIISKKEF